jgi:hypothetical protein
LLVLICRTAKAEPPALFNPQFETNTTSIIRKSFMERFDGNCRALWIELRSDTQGGESSCASSKLNPRDLIGGFERMAIACLYGDADKLTSPARPQRIPKPHRAAVGIDRPAPSDCGARAQRNSSPVLSPLGSAVLDLILTLVVPMARQPDHRAARNGLALAP